MGDKHNHKPGHTAHGAHTPKGDHAGDSKQAEAPRIDFSTFVLSLTGSAMVQLGRVPDPTGENGGIDLGLARQAVDILTMLRTKTAGNLAPPEADLLERVLHDLRVAWVEEAQKHVG
jgi:hypothetical protein